MEYIGIGDAQASVWAFLSFIESLQSEKICRVTV